MKTNKLTIILLIIILFVILPINVWAKGQIILRVDKTDLEVGEELVVTASVKDETEFYALTATLSYDSSVFEEITPEDFILANEVLDLSYNNETNKFGIVNKVGLISGELFQIHLKAKQNANVGNTNIALTNITSSDGENKITYEKEVLQVLVTKNAQENEVLNNTKPNEITEVQEEVIKVLEIFILVYLLFLPALLSIYLVRIWLKKMLIMMGKKRMKMPKKSWNIF